MTSKTSKICSGVGAALIILGTVPVLAPPLQASGIFRVSDNRVYGLLSRLEKNTDIFRKSVDRALDRSRLDGAPAEDRINGYIADFEDATDRLQNRFNNNQRVVGDVQTVLIRGKKIDQVMPVPGRNWKQANKDWQRVRNNLQELAQVTRGVNFP